VERLLAKGDLVHMKMQEHLQASGVELSEAPARPVEGREPVEGLVQTPRVHDTKAAVAVPMVCCKGSEAPEGQPEPLGRMMP
jgi:hypothetical protein